MKSVPYPLRGALAAFCAASALATAGYPDHPISLVVGYPAGGSVDLTARLFGEELAKRMGQSVVVENRPGAGGVIAAQVAATAAPDGYTIFMGTVGTQVVNPLIYAKLSYDPDKFVPVGLVSGS